MKAGEGGSAVLCCAVHTCPNSGCVSLGKQVKYMYVLVTNNVTLVTDRTETYTHRGIYHQSTTSSPQPSNFQIALNNNSPQNKIERKGRKRRRKGTQSRVREYPRVVCCISTLGGSPPLLSVSKATFGPRTRRQCPAFLEIPPITR